MQMKIRNLLYVLLGAVFIAGMTPIISLGQAANGGKDVNVVNTPSVNVNNPVTLSAGTSVGVSSSASNPIFVREERTTALAFQALDGSFSLLNDLDVTVGPYDKIRVLVQNHGFNFSLTLTLMEAGRSVGILDVINVQGACPDLTCGDGSVTTTRIYELPGRTIRFSTNVDPRLKGDVVIFGR